MAAKLLKWLVERLMVDQADVIRTYLPAHAPLPPSASICMPMPISKQEIRAGQINRLSISLLYDR